VPDTSRWALGLAREAQTGRFATSRCARLSHPARRPFRAPAAVLRTAAPGRCAAPGHLAVTPAAPSARKGQDRGFAAGNRTDRDRFANTGRWAREDYGMTDRLLCPAQVAARCGLSRRAVYDAIRRGELEAIRLCSRLRIRPEALEAWLDSNAVTADRPQQLPRAPSLVGSPVGSFRVLLNTGTEDE